MHEGKTMKNSTITAVAAAISISFSAAAIADGMSKSEYNADKNNIQAEYKAAKAVCGQYKSNAKDICVAEAKGKEHIALAELEARYQPSPKADYNVLIARAQADYSVAKQKCDDMSGNSKDVCVKEAKAALAAAKADAAAHMKTADAR
jgi:hypothetical protein